MRVNRTFLILTLFTSFPALRKFFASVAKWSQGNEKYQHPDSISHQSLAKCFPVLAVSSSPLLAFVIDVFSRLAVDVFRHLALLTCFRSFCTYKAVGNQSLDKGFVFCFYLYQTANHL